MSICYDKKLIFIHISKNAGTSVNNLLKKYHTNFNEDYYFDDPTWRYYKLFYPDEWNTYTSFCIIRDPVDRFISNYNFAKTLFKNHKVKHLDHELCTNMSINELIFNLKNKNISLKSHHWRPQYFWVCDSNLNIKVNKIIHIKNLKNDLLNLGLDGCKIKMSNKSKNYCSIKNISKENVKFIEEMYNLDYKIFNFG